MKYEHIPVMLNEVSEYLRLRPGYKVIDCTLGGAGYTLAMAREVGEKGSVLAIDLDKMAIENALELKSKNKLSNIILVNDNFANLKNIVKEYYAKNVKFNGIVFDLGLSGAQLKDRSRGFSFKFNAPLKMEFRKRGRASGKVEHILNLWPEARIEKIIREYGEEKYARSIARKIINYRRNRKIETTEQLVAIIRSAVPRFYQNNKKIHFATRTFQALRIAANDELANLEKVLPQALDLLKKRGRLIVISYHSLEDRIVKNFFRQESRDCICPPEAPLCQCDHKARLKIIKSKEGKKFLVPSEEEVQKNKSARSAKMRVAEVI